VRGHEINDLGGHLFGRTDQIAFVFAVFVVDDNYHFAVADILRGFLNGC
jgi:hypothetical protein